MNSILSIARYSLAAMLFTSALIHLDNNFAYLSSVYAYRIGPAELGLVVGAVVPPLQLVLVSCLCFYPTLYRSAALWSAALFLVFLAGQSSALIRGLNIACGCFGSKDDNPIGWKSLSTAGLGLTLSLLIYFLSRRSITMPEELTDETPRLHVN